MKLLWITLILNFSLYAQAIDLIIFSKDRAMQLDLLLRSINQNFIGEYTQTVIYKYSGNTEKQCYDILIKEYNGKNINFINQTDINFRHITLDVLNKCKSQYVMFCVDDNVVIRSIDLNQCLEYIDQVNICGFYLRLGRNINYCYTEQKNTAVPIMKQIDNNIYTFHFHNNQGDWGYPYTVDMTIYNKNKVINMFKSLDFKSPNTLELAWFDNYGRSIAQNTFALGLCFTESKIINIPMNIVQEDWPDMMVHMGYTSYFFNDLFLRGYRFKINKLSSIKTNSTHKNENISYYLKLGGKNE